MSDFFKSVQEGFKRATNTRNLVDGLNASSLNSAVRAGNHERIRVLIKERGYDPNAYNLAGETAFHEAIKIGSVTLAKLLIELGANPLQPCRGAYQNPIHLAVTANQPRMVSFLKALGVPLNAFSQNGQAPLHHAVDEDKPDVVKALIRAGADPLLQTKSGRTAAMMAITQNKPDILDALLSEPLAHKSLQSSYYHIYDGLEPPLALAIRLGRTDMARRLIEAGLGINHPGRNGKTPLHYAIEHRNIELIEYLLRHGADCSKAVDDTGETPLQLLCRDRKTVEDDSFFERALSLMMAYSADLSVKDNKGFTALYWLSIGPELTLDRFKAFVEAGADPVDSAPDDVLALPLRLVMNKRLPCLEFLLERGHIKINDLYGPDKTSLLHAAVQRDRGDLIEILLAHKPDLTIRNAAGETPVDMAAKYNNQSLVDRFLALRAADQAADSAQPRAKQNKPRKPG